LYVLDGNERHELHAETDLRMVCVFTPALTGREVHDADGAYPLLTDDAPSVNGQHRDGHRSNGDTSTLASTNSETS
jgi:hypothetical protein